MAGHSHWAGIKHKKEAADQKRGQVFSKLLAAIAVAAKTEPNPEFNPRLRDAIQNAKAHNVPAENIERAIRRAGEANENQEELILEAYGPGGVALLIEAATDSKNRTVAEVKRVLHESGAKWAEAGSVQWAFRQIADRRGSDPSMELGAGADRRGQWVPTFKQELSPEDKSKLKALIAALHAHDDVQEVYTNAT